jgi:hypothetical protein
MKTYGGSGCIDSRFLDLGTRLRWVVSFTPLPLYQGGKSPRYPLERRRHYTGWTAPARNVEAKLSWFCLVHMSASCSHLWNLKILTRAEIFYFLGLSRRLLGLYFKMDHDHVFHTLRHSPFTHTLTADMLMFSTWYRTIKQREGETSYMCNMKIRMRKYI